MKIRLYRDPMSDAGGSAPANGGSPAPASPASSSAPSAAAGGQSPFESFRAGLAKTLAKDPSTSQPPNGKDTAPAATGTEGEDADRISDSEDTGTTAKPEGDTTPGEEQKGADENGWTEEEQAELKAHALEKLQHSAEGRALLKSYREARAEKDRVAGSNSNLVTRMSQMEAALHSGDAKALQALGYDLKLDQRTPEKIIDELETDYNTLKGAFEPLFRQLVEAGDTATAEAVKKAFNKASKTYQDRAAVIQKEQERQSLKAELLQEAGIKPETKNAYAKLAENAEKHLTALTQQDPKAGEYYKLLEKETAPGGALHAMGVTLARGYGLSPQTAKMMHEIGKGLFFANNQKTILEGERRKWERDREKRAVTSSPGGDHPTPPSGQKPSGASHLRAGMRHMMGQST